MLSQSMHKASEHCEYGSRQVNETDLKNLTKRIVLLNTIKKQPIEILEQASADLHVITEPQFANLYGPDWQVHVVSNVEHLDEVRAVALSLQARKNIDHVIGASERCLQAAGYLNSLLDLDGVDFRTANRASNKVAMKSRLRQCGIEVARHMVINSESDLSNVGDTLGWPIMIKPALGTGSQLNLRLDGPLDTAPAQSQRTWRRLVETQLPILAEEYIDMDWEFHCEGAVIDGQVQFAAPARALNTRFEGFGKTNGSYSLSLSSSDGKEISDLLQRTVTSLGIRSAVTHLEGFKVDDSYLVGEITVRPAGGGIPDLVLTQHKVDLWQVFISLALNDIPLIHPISTEQIYAECWMPVTRGIVQAISTKKELDQFPNVITSKVHLKVGDYSPAPEYSWSRSAEAIVTVPASSNPESTIAAVTDAFKLVIRED